MSPNKSLDGIQTQKKSSSQKKKLSFFSSLKKTKKRFLSSLLILSLFLGGGFFFFQNTENIKGATYGWIQSNWGGGQTANTATHTDNQENWTEFESKDPNIVTTQDGVSISGTSDSWVETTDGDFNDVDSYSFVGTYTLNNTVYVRKPFGASCTTSAECQNGSDGGNSGGFCNAGICTDPWQAGPCAGILVHALNAPDSKWKTTNTNCDTPECGLDGEQDGDTLVFDNSIDFSLYPARNVCKSFGARLPTQTEFNCIFSNKSFYETYASFGGEFWSSREVNNSYAYYIRMSDGYWFTGWHYSHTTKSGINKVRCVR